MSKQKVELLSPAGNLEKLKIAINYGADAVYGGAGSCGTDAAGGVCLFNERQGCAGKADCEEA